MAYIHSIISKMMYFCNRPFPKQMILWRNKNNSVGEVYRSAKHLPGTYRSFVGGFSWLLQVRKLSTNAHKSETTSQTEDPGKRNDGLQKFTFLTTNLSDSFINCNSMLHLKLERSTNYWHSSRMTPCRIQMSFRDLKTAMKCHF